MPITYEPIQTQTLGTATNTVTFSSIPSTYTDLVLVAMATNSTGDSDLCMRFNSITTTTYSSRFMFSSGSGSGTVATNSNLNRMRIGRTDNTTRYPNIINIMNYSNSAYNKSVISRSANGGLTLQHVGYWRSTAAINTVTLTDENGYNFSIGSVFTLYGIKAA
jgi:hypothetical protein